MDAREQRGLVIAATCRLNRLNDGTWLVPSQSHKDGATTYRVNLEAKTCTCLDHTEGEFTCKHYYAALTVCKRDVLADGTVIETKTVTLTEKKIYKQDWPKYNVAQATEKGRVRVLLQDLCSRLPARERAGDKLGPKSHHPSDAVFTMAYKVYCGFSARRAALQRQPPARCKSLCDLNLGRCIGVLFEACLVERHGAWQGRCRLVPVSVHCPFSKHYLKRVIFFF